MLLLSRYNRLGASSRMRLLQYKPFLKSCGWKIHVSPLFTDRYVEALYGGKSRWKYVIIGYWSRLIILLKITKYDLIWIEKELFPFMPALAEHILLKFKVPYVVDYDDAINHLYDRHRKTSVRYFLGNKIQKVMQNAKLVIAGNDYLASVAKKAGSKRIEVIPTVVDINRYNITAKNENNNPLIVGWIGSPATMIYLFEIESVYKKILDKYNVSFVAVGASKKLLKNLPFEVKSWSEETEVSIIQSFDIGIMPLKNSPWEQGKCGYKLIQYMACGIPVIGSGVGVNNQIVKHGSTGFIAKSLEDWEKRLEQLLDSKHMRSYMGVKGRECVENIYSLQVQAPKLDQLLRDALRK